MIQKVFTENAPRPAGHYSQAIEHEGVLYVSGQLPIKPNVKNNHVGTIEDQTSQALSNLSAILLAANSDLNHVLKITIYIADISLWDRVNSVCVQFFDKHLPARAIVPSKELHFGFQVEIEAVAAVKSH